MSLSQLTRSTYFFCLVFLLFSFPPQIHSQLVSAEKKFDDESALFRRKAAESDRMASELTASGLNDDMRTQVSIGLVSMSISLVSSVYVNVYGQCLHRTFIRGGTHLFL